MSKDLKLKVIIDQEGNAQSKIGGLSSVLGSLGGIAGGILTGGLAVAGAGIVALGASLVTSVGAAMDAQAGQAQLQAVLKSTGGASGMTADAINDLASSLQATTPFEDDAILAGENMLLTFTNIGKDVFPDATKAAVDMAQALGTDVAGQAMALGKALNDPVAGVGALSRVGVKFTKEQEKTIKAMVKMGDTAGAQQIILAELNKEFGGSAEAAGNTLPGKLAILQHTFGDIQETIGMAFIPILSEAADMLASGLNSDLVQGALAELTGFISNTVVPGIKTISQAFIDLIRYVSFTVSSGDSLNDWLSHLPDVIQPAVKFIGDAIVVIQDLARYIFFTVDSGDSLNDWLVHLPEAIQPAVKFIGDLITGFQQLGTWITNIATAVWPLLQQAIQFTIDNFNIIGPVIAAVGAVILALSSPLTAIVAGVILLATAWAQNWGGIQEITQSVLDFLKPKWDDLVAVFDKFITLLLPELQKVWQELVTVWAAQVQPALAELWASLQELFTALGLGTGKTDLWGVALTLLKGFLAGTLLAVRNMIPVIRFLADGLVFMIGQVRSSIDRFIAFKQGVEGIIGAVGRLISRVRDLARYLADLVIPDFLQSNSPPPLQVGLEGIAAAAGRVGSKLPAAFAGLPASGLAPSLAGAGAMATGGGVAPIIVNLTYSPLISTASKEEAQNILGPFIAEGIRRDKSGTR